MPAALMPLVSPRLTKKCLQQLDLTLGDVASNLGQVETWTFSFFGLSPLPQSRWEVPFFSSLGKTSLTAHSPHPSWGVVSPHPHSRALAKWLPENSCLQKEKFETHWFKLSPGHSYYRLPGGTSGKESICQCKRDARDTVSTPGSGRSLGVGAPLQYSCLGNSMNRGARRATGLGVEESWTGLWDWAHIFMTSNVYQIDEGSAKQIRTRDYLLAGLLTDLMRCKLKLGLNEWVNGCGGLDPTCHNWEFG